MFDIHIKGIDEFGKSIENTVAFSTPILAQAMVDSAAVKNKATADIINNILANIPRIISSICYYGGITMVFSVGIFCVGNIVSQVIIHRLTTKRKNY